MVRPRSVTTSPDPQLSAYSPHFPTGFFRVLTGFFPGFNQVLTRFFPGFKKTWGRPGKNLVQFSPTPSMADPLWRSPKFNYKKAFLELQSRYWQSVINCQTSKVGNSSVTVIV